MTSYSRQDVLRILQISSHQLQGWERAGLVPSQQAFTFQDLGQLRTLRALREDDVSAASIRNSIVAMKAVAGMANPLLEASLVRTGTRLAFRCDGAMVDPIRRQLL
ncbi:MAG: MerR family transcriptional regulator, partial [Terracidiphilus sp.]